MKGRGREGEGPGRGGACKGRGREAGKERWGGEGALQGCEAGEGLSASWARVRGLPGPLLHGCAHSFILIPLHVPWVMGRPGLGPGGQALPLELSQLRQGPGMRQA